MMSKLKKRREKMKLRQVDLARKANVSITWLWTLENGFEERVSSTIKKRVAAALDCEYDELFQS